MDDHEDFNTKSSFTLIEIEKHGPNLEKLIFVLIEINGNKAYVTCMIIYIYMYIYIHTNVLILIMV